MIEESLTYINSFRYEASQTEYNKITDYIKKNKALLSKEVKTQLEAIREGINWRYKRLEQAQNQEWSTITASKWPEKGTPKGWHNARLAPKLELFQFMASTKAWKSVNNAIASLKNELKLPE